MPITIKSFGRRKSSGNVLDSEFVGDAPAGASFRVLERPQKKPSGHAGEPEVKRSFASPLQALRGKSVDNLALSQNRSVPAVQTLALRPGLTQSRGKSFCASKSFDRVFSLGCSSLSSRTIGD